MEFSLAGIVWRMVGLLALVFANGFFVAAEFSIVTVRKTRIDQLVAEGHWGARGGPAGGLRPGQLHCRHAARHHDGQPRTRMDGRAGARRRDSAGARHAARPDRRGHRAQHQRRHLVRDHHRAAHRARRARAEDHRARAIGGDRAVGGQADRDLHEGLLGVHPAAERDRTRSRQPARSAQPRRACDGAFGRGAEDAGHGEPGSGRARRAGRADDPPRLRVRRSDGRPGDGAAHRAGRDRSERDARRCCSTW